MKQTFILLISFLWMAPAHAQENYVPPPMFDAPMMNAQPHEIEPSAGDDQGTIVSRYSPQAPAVPAGETTTAILPPVVMHNDPALTRPRAPKKPATLTPARMPVPPKKPKITITAAKTPQIPVVTSPGIQHPAIEKPAKLMPAARVTSKGVVTGPKTMPSVPTTDVAAVSTFRTKPMQGQTLLERHQTRGQEQASPVKENAIATPELPAQLLRENEKGVQHLSIAYPAGATSLDDPPLSSLIDAMQADASRRLLIQAYANPVDRGENSDRRIALARALDLRNTLLSQQIESHRIDIRALGAQSAKKPADRVDLMLYKPQNSAD